MYKKVLVTAILLSLFIAGNLFAQSIDVVVHNVLKGGDVVKLYKQEIPTDPLYLCATKPAPEGTGWTTVTFENVLCTQASPIWALQAEQCSRSVYKQDCYSPFNTYHLYLPTNGIEPEPEEPEPHQQ